MRKICWAANFALSASVKSVLFSTVDLKDTLDADGNHRAYQAISDDSPPSLAMSFGTMLLSFRPDRELTSTLTDPPRESFKNQYDHVKSS